jgi:hypothetical protein
MTSISKSALDMFVGRCNVHADARRSAVSVRAGDFAPLVGYSWAIP